MIQVAAVIQTRMGSTRCPGKALRTLSGVPLTEHIIKRLQQVEEIQIIVLAVPDASSEQPLIDLARQLKVKVFQGPEEDVLQRFILAGEAFQATHLLRVCGDNPLIDITLARTLIASHLESQADYTVSIDSIPIGTGTEIVRSAALRQIGEMTQDPAYREHVITWFRDFPENFKLMHPPAPSYLRDKPFRLTVDTDSDLKLMDHLYNHFYSPDRPVLDLETILVYLESHPEVARINSEVIQKDWRE